MNKQTFDSASALEHQLVTDILAALNNGLEENGVASLLFSGGSTPKALMNQLAQQDFNWEHVRIGLVDDRMVSANDSASNARLVKEQFLNRIEGTAPTFYPLVLELHKPINLLEAMGSVEKIGVPDVVILGMGTDGHFASLFPNDANSQHGLEDHTCPPLLYTTAPVHPKERISHSWNYLKSARHLFLHFTGQAKMNLIDGKANRAELPIDAVLNASDIKPTLYWTP